jgi:hypothetical protein
MIKASCKNHRHLSHGKIARAITAFILIFGFCSCGAKVKNADQVASLFAEAQTLQSKLDFLCKKLSSEDFYPSLSQLHLTLADLNNCEAAGLAASELRNMGSFKYQLMRTVGNTGSTAVWTRSQIWTTRKLFSFLAVMLQRFSNGLNKTNFVEEMSEIFSKKSGASQNWVAGAFASSSKTMQIDVGVLGDVKFNTADMKLAIDMSVKGSGLADIDVDIGVIGAPVESKGLVTIVGTSRVGSTSFLKDLKMIILIIPHAENTYIDAFVGMEVDSLGFIDTMIQDIIGPIAGIMVKLIFVVMG